MKERVSKCQAALGSLCRQVFSFSVCAKSHAKKTMVECVRL